MKSWESYRTALLITDFLGDRVGRKVMALAACPGWTTHSLPTGFSTTFQHILGERFLTGHRRGLFFNNDRPISITPGRRLRARPSSTGGCF